MTARWRDTARDTLSLSFRMPAEWERHKATWMAWPHYEGDWPGKFEPIPWVYAEIIRHLARHERVELIVNDAASEKRARKVLDRANALNDNIRFHRWLTNRVWTRDSGCSFVISIDHVGAGAPPPPARGGHTGGGPRPHIQRPAAGTGRLNALAKYPNYKKEEKISSPLTKTAGAQELPTA